MPPFKPLKFSVIKQKLESLGFIVVSQKGSHVKFAKITDDGVITAIVPNHREVTPGTIKSIIKQAMLDPDDFYEL